jgi:hypothetical protein
MIPILSIDYLNLKDPYLGIREKLEKKGLIYNLPFETILNYFIKPISFYNNHSLLIYDELTTQVISNEINFQYFLFSIRQFDDKPIHKFTFNQLYLLYKLFFIIMVFGNTNLRIKAIHLYNDILILFSHKGGKEKLYSRNRLKLACNLFKIHKQLLILLNYLPELIDTEIPLLDIDSQPPKIYIDFVYGVISFPENYSSELERMEEILYYAFKKIQYKEYNYDPNPIVKSQPEVKPVEKDITEFTYEEFAEFFKEPTD